MCKTKCCPLYTQSKFVKFYPWDVLTELNPLFSLSACDSRRMQHGNGAQQAVLWPVQLPIRAIRRGVHGARSHRDRVTPPPSPLLSMCSVQISHCDCATTLRSWGQRKEAGGGGGVQVWDGPRGKECFWISLIWFCLDQLEGKALNDKNC